MAAIQQALLPSHLPAIPGVRAALHYRPFDRVSGDLYDVHRLSEEPAQLSNRNEKWRLFIADVSGHGPSTSMMMTMVLAYLQSCPVEIIDPGQLLTYLNEKLFQRSTSGFIVTAAAAIYESQSRKLHYASAGHPPVLHRRTTQDGPAVARLSTAGGPPLGVMVDTSYEAATTQLHNGDLIVLYTDGVTERRDAQGRLFGLTGLQRAMTSHTQSARATMDAVMSAAKRHGGNGGPDDDETLIILEMIQ